MLTEHSITEIQRNQQQQTQFEEDETIKFQLCSYQDNLGASEYRKDRRVNGIQLPLHPLQLIGWLALICFGLATFLILIPSLHPTLQQPLFGLLSGLYIIHSVSHLAALLIDPADKELRSVKIKKIVPEFDRTKHYHVIENGRCHLCNIKTTSSRTKHCSVCNKCVGKFDHHCKWLNHCIGGRNYVAFLMCVVSAVIAALVILAAAITEIVLYHVDPQWLNLWDSGIGGGIIVEQTINGTQPLSPNGDGGGGGGGPSSSSTTSSLSTTTTTTILTQQTSSTVTTTNATGDFFLNQTFIGGAGNLTEQSVGSVDGIGVHNTIFLIFIGVLGILAAVTAGLLLHLCFFHIYISFLGLTTYEYIRNHRQNVMTNVPQTNANNTSNSGIGGGQQRNDLNDPSTTSTLTTNPKTQLYFCSKLNTNKNQLIDINDKKLNYRPKTLHCCDTSREYHKTSSSLSDGGGGVGGIGGGTHHKSYYLCSLLEENLKTTNAAVTQLTGTGTTQLQPVGGINDKQLESRTFHCCSEYRKTETLSPSNNDTTTTTTTESFVHYSEQCTFCSFRIKSPTPKNFDIKNLKNFNQELNGKKCCLKTMTKHHRWKRKWNCCSNVPDSPDIPIVDIEQLQTISQTIPMQTQFTNSTNIPSIITTSSSSVVSAATCNANSNSTNVMVGTPMTISMNLNNNSVAVPIQQLLNNGRRDDDTIITENLLNNERIVTSTTVIQQSQREYQQNLNEINDNNGANRINNNLSVNHNNNNNFISTVGSGGGNGVSLHQLQHNDVGDDDQIRDESDRLTIEGGISGDDERDYQNNYHPHHYHQSPSSNHTHNHELNGNETVSFNRRFKRFRRRIIIPYTPVRFRLMVRMIRMYGKPMCPEIQEIYRNNQVRPLQMETILPTSIIRNCNEQSQQLQQQQQHQQPMSRSGMQLPALPPPSRRRIRMTNNQTNDLQELSDSLGFVHHQQQQQQIQQQQNLNNQTTIRIPTKSSYRRSSRRKNVLRSRSSTLSPIHESGLSNPTSPQPCRHIVCGSGGGVPTTLTTQTMTTTGVCGSIGEMSP